MKPEIVLKSIKLHKGLSEETPAYTARVLVGGKPFADVSNSGHGGCDMVYPVKGAVYPGGFDAALKAKYPDAVILNTMTPEAAFAEAEKVIG